jgi:predicted nucleic acid-binding protein
VNLVLDSSVAIAWLHADEATDAVRKVLDEVRDGGAWVPSLWKLEVANSLEMGVRRGRHPGSVRDSMLAQLSQLPIRIDPETDRQAWSATLRLAERHHLTLYDAAYLELAQRRGLPLATLDRDLRQAALAEGLELVGT